MVEIQPTQFLSVSHVFEKMNDKMSAALANVNGIKRKLVSWAKKKIKSEGLDVIHGLVRFMLVINDTKNNLNQPKF